MSDDFFKQKKEWSRYKDFILDYYLTPYLEKVKFLKRPIVLVDCCAGPGMFEDGSEGSPLIIARHIQTMQIKGIDAKGLFLEKKRKFFVKLQTNLKPYEGFAETKLKDFKTHLDQIRSMTKDSTVFLYVDPYGIKELPFSDLADIYGSIGKHNSSVEVLLNFNSAAFVRCALVALKMDTGDFDLEIEEGFLDDMVNSTEGMTPDQLDKIAGGDYWTNIVSDGKLSFAAKETAMADAYMQQLNEYFPRVCSFPVQRKYGQLPKYRLLYGTRHEDGVLLMNDAMYKARERFLAHEFADGRLFDLRPLEECKNTSVFKDRLFQIVRKNGPISRKALKLKAMQDFFCLYNSTDYSNAVRELLSGTDAHRIYSLTGKTRINDSELLATEPFE